MESEFNRIAVAMGRGESALFVCTSDRMAEQLASDFFRFARDRMVESLFPLVRMDERTSLKSDAGGSVKFINGLRDHRGNKRLRGANVRFVCDDLVDVPEPQWTPEQIRARRRLLNISDGLR